VRVIYRRKKEEWVECPLVGLKRGKTKKIYSSLEGAYEGAWKNCKDNELLVEQDSSGFPVSWRI
jgi:hypothetical protein